MRRCVLTIAVCVSVTALTSAQGQKRRAPSINTTAIAPPPITPALRETYGSWIVEDLGKGLYSASITTQNGNLFGVLCGSSVCHPVVATGSTCDEDAKYPLLINSPAAAYNDTGKCKHFGKLTIMVMNEMEGVAESLSIGGVIGVATPMQSGEFKVSRFTLTGGLRAYARARQLSGAKAEEPAKDDQRL